MYVLCGCICACACVLSVCSVRASCVCVVCECVCPLCVSSVCVTINVAEQLDLEAVVWFCVHSLRDARQCLYSRSMPKAEARGLVCALCVCCVYVLCVCALCVCVCA